MISYSIDASVYAYPFQQAPSDVNEIYNYCKTINDLCDAVNKKQPRNKKFYLFLRDIKFIYKHKELNFISQDISPLDQLLKDNKIKINLLRDAQENLEMFYNRFYSNPKEEDKLPEKIIFEKWFNIENVIFKDNKIFTLPNDINKMINNKELKKNMAKNLAKIAFLNKYVYNNNDKIHNIVLGGSISAQPIQIKNTDFNVTMSSGSFKHKETTYTYNYIIKDVLPLQDIHIETQNINISTMDTLVRDDHNYQTGEWEKALNDAKNDFKFLKFGHEVKTSLEEYINKIEKEYNNLSVETQKNKIKKWRRDGPDSIYENLKTLDTFVSTANLCSFLKNLNERYHCNNNCEFINACSSNLRFFSVDCSDESQGSKNDPFVKADRIRINSEGKPEIYWTHLKLRSDDCDNPLWFLNLRIHFRILVSYTAPKIEIGWIGRHLYLPCTDEKKRSNCVRRYKCPRHPDFPTNVNKLIDYRDQWSKQEPEKEQSKTEESEKSSIVLPENP